MSTRAVYTVKDSADTFHVYIHCDGYPSGAAEHIAAAVPFAWTLPRFEAMDFAAALIAGNKKQGGGNVYCTSGYDAHGDLAYRYEIAHGADGLHVAAYQREWSHEAEDKYTSIFAGPLAAFTKFAKAKTDA